MKVLLIKGTPAAQGSKSWEIAQELASEFKAQNPSATIETIDLYGIDLPEIDTDVLTAWGKFATGGEPTATEASKVEKLNAMVDKFIGADRYIVQSSMYNLGIPHKLKGYLDACITAGKAFKYTEKGPEGLLTDKKAIHVHGAGGFYSGGQAPEFSDSYIQGILGFAGIQVKPTIWIEGVDFDPSKKDEVMAAALEKAKAAVKDLA